MRCIIHNKLTISDYLNLKIVDDEIKIQVNDTIFFTLCHPSELDL